MFTNFDTDIQKIIIHCAATQNGRALGVAGGRSAAEVIDRWHIARGFHRRYANVKTFNPHLTSIGYHYVIDVDGQVDTGRRIGEVGAHVLGHNKKSVGICLVGTDSFTRIQWQKLDLLVSQLLADFGASVHGHREFANKICPGFDVSMWQKGGRLPMRGHILEATQ